MNTSETLLSQNIDLSANQFEIVDDHLSRLELLETCWNLSPSLREQEFILPFRNSTAPSYSVEEYAEAALCCLKENEVETVETYFLSTRLISTYDIRIVLRKIAERIERDKQQDIHTRSMATLAANKTVMMNVKSRAGKH